MSKRPGEILMHQLAKYIDAEGAGDELLRDIEKILGRKVSRDEKMVDLIAESGRKPD